jgi:UDP:flavonoid glycosyltransferase YjiC (YdhE family)
MRILFSSTKGLGHFRPLVPYAMAARVRGHSVCFATPDGMDETLKSYGLRAATPVGPE